MAKREFEPEETVGILRQRAGVKLVGVGCAIAVGVIRRIVEQMVQAVCQFPGVRHAVAVAIFRQHCRAVVRAR